MHKSNTNRFCRIRCSIYVAALFALQFFSSDLHAMSPLKPGVSRVLGHYSRQTHFFSQGSSWFRGFSRSNSVVRSKPFSARNHTKDNDALDLLIKNDPVKNSRKISSIYNEIGKSLTKKKDYNGAIENYRNAIEKQVLFLGQDHLLIANFYLKIADLYDVLGEYDEEIKCCREHLRIRKKILGRNHRFVAAAMARLAQALKKKKKFQDAVSVHLLELEVRKEIGNFSDTMKTKLFSDIASSYISIQDYELASEFIDKALEAAHAVGDEMSLARVYNLAARLSLKKKAYENAIEYGNKVLQLFPKSKKVNIEVAHCHKIIGDAQLLLGEIEKGVGSLRIASEIFTDTVGGYHVWTQATKQALKKASKTRLPLLPAISDEVPAVSILEDRIFRKVFGDPENTRILMHFLNSMLGLRGEKRVTAIKLLPSYKKPLPHESKKIIIDVSCIDQNGTIYIIEMQRSSTMNVFEKRVSYYAAKAITEQARRGDGYDKLNKVVFLGILDFTFLPDEPNCVSHHGMCNTKTGLSMSDVFSYTFVELPKFRKKLGTLEKDVDRWIYFIKNSHTIKEFPSQLHIDEIRECFDILADD